MTDPITRMLDAFHGSEPMTDENATGGNETGSARCASCGLPDWNPIHGDFRGVAYHGDFRGVAYHLFAEPAAQPPTDLCAECGRPWDSDIHGQLAGCHGYQPAEPVPPVVLVETQTRHTPTPVNPFELEAMCDEGD